MFIRPTLIALGAASLVAGGAAATLVAAAPVTTAAVTTPAAAHATFMRWDNGAIRWPGGGWPFRGLVPAPAPGQAARR
jgi:hypothetical protein